mmetsp:Transcript_36989/g.92047  ORF Transcript_36989/g.92047 Transcript_36989/m.92047 type:complete len:421 (+) Transcript_36989:834-2096(+)
MLVPQTLDCGAHALVVEGAVVADLAQRLQRILGREVRDRHAECGDLHARAPQVALDVPARVRLRHHAEKFAQLHAYGLAGDGLEALRQKDVEARVVAVRAELRVPAHQHEVRVDQGDEAAPATGLFDLSLLLVCVPLARTQQQLQFLGLRVVAKPDMRARASPRWMQLQHIVAQERGPLLVAGRRDVRARLLQTDLLQEGRHRGPHLPLHNRRDEVLCNRTAKRHRCARPGEQQHAQGAHVAHLDGQVEGGGGDALGGEQRQRGHLGDERFDHGTLSAVRKYLHQTRCPLSVGVQRFVLGREWVERDARVGLHQLGQSLDAFFGEVGALAQTAGGPGLKHGARVDWLDQRQIGAVNRVDAEGRLARRIATVDEIGAIGGECHGGRPVAALAELCDNQTGCDVEDVHMLAVIADGEGARVR